MLYDGLDMTACLRLLGMEIQREGKLITWSSASLESGIRRWAAIYEYEDGFYAQSTLATREVDWIKTPGLFGPG
jgi:hypothetical protein